LEIEKSLTERIKNIRESPTIAFGEKANRMKAQGIDVISFAMGEPDFDTPENIKEAGKKAIEIGDTKYTAVSGIEELKEAIINKFKRDNGLDYDKSEIIISCGVKHALYNLSQVLFEKDDEVIILSPYWVTYPTQVKLANAIPVIVDISQFSDFRLPVDLIERNITSKTKAIILNNPCNPTGVLFDQEILEVIGKIAVERSIYIISDEIYEKIRYDDINYVSIASLGEDIRKQTIVLNGVSKSHAMTGWRIGYAAGTTKIIEAMNKIQGQITSNPSSISQVAAVEALNGPQESVQMMRKEYERRRNYIIKHLNSIDGFHCMMPKGAFYAFPNIAMFFGKKYADTTISNSIDFTFFLLNEAKIAVVPGIAFGSNDFIRFSYATSMANIEKGLERIKNAIERLE